MRQQRVRQLRDREHEHQVEEQLDHADAAAARNISIAQQCTASHGMNYPLRPMKLSNLLAALALVLATPAVAQVCPYQNLMPEFTEFVTATQDLAPQPRAEAFVERFASKHPDFYSESLFGSREKMTDARRAPVRSAAEAEISRRAADHARRRARRPAAASRPTTRASRRRSARRFPTTAAKRRSASASRSIMFDGNQSSKTAGQVADALRRRDDLAAASAALSCRRSSITSCCTSTRRSRSAPPCRRTRSNRCRGRCGTKGSRPTSAGSSIRR